MHVHTLGKIMDDDFFLQPTERKFSLLDKDLDHDVSLPTGKSRKLNIRSVKRDGVNAVLVTPTRSLHVEDFVNRTDANALPSPRGNENSTTNDKESKNIDVAQTAKENNCDIKRDTVLKGASIKDTTLGVGDKIFQTLKFVVKKGRVFEIRKLTRRIQLLRKKKGNEAETNKNKRKIAKLLATIEVMKNLNVFDACNRLSVLIEEMFEKIRVEVNLSSDSIHWLEILKNSINCEDDLELVYCLRFLQLKNVLAKFNEEIKEHFQAFIDEIKSCEKFEHLSSTGSCQLKEKENNGVELCEHSVDSKPRKQRRKFDRANEKHKVANTRRNGIHMINEEAKCVPDSSKSPQTDVAPLLQKVAKSKRKHCSLSPDSDEKKLRRFKTQLQKSRNKHGNRLGQRARRELWEKMYGKDAAHIKKAVKSKQRQIKKQYDVGNGSNSNRKHGGNKNRQQNTETIENNLHPSWQARKHQKLQSQIVQFQGVKIKFDD